MKRRVFIKSLAATGAVALLSGAGYIYRSSRLQVSHERVLLPQATEKVRIVALSDLHAPCLYTSVAHLIAVINAHEPDIFILAGDTVDKSGNEPIVESFKQVKARLAKVATLGNWEYLGKLDLDKLRWSYGSAGISLLVNDILEAPGLTIAGFDDFVMGSPHYEILSDESLADRPLLVTSHCPGCFDRITSLARSRIVLISGHTHGGQVAPFGIALITPEGSGPYVQGWYQREEHSMYVMRGIGTSPGLPVRMGARPELLVLDFAPAPA
jgi:predicted MPP superfamily phosphohydrolase